MKQRLQSKKSSKKKRLLWIIVILVPLLAVASAFAYREYKKPEPAKTTSKSKTAQSDYKDGKERPTDGGSLGNSQGGAVDNKGDDTPADNTTPSVTSPSGVITVLGIENNTLLKSGNTLRGTAKDLAQIQFRVIDDSVGVLAQGSLSVVNGSFSGELKFDPKAGTGRLDVFNFDAAGTENNNLEIPVRFK